MLGVPRERASGFTAAFSLVAIVLAFLVAPATSRLLDLAGVGDPPDESGKVVLPGGRTVDPSRPGPDPAADAPEDTPAATEPAG